MQQVNVALSMEDWDRLQKILPAGQTVYSFAKEALLGRIREAEKNGPSSLGPSAIVLEMVAALRHRKWHLYQREDYSDMNHRHWLETRFRRASKMEILDAIGLFRGVVEK